MVRWTLLTSLCSIGWSLKKQPRPRDELGFWTRTLPRDENDVAIRGIRPPKKRPEDFGKKFNYVRRRNLLEKSRQYVENVMSQPPFDASHDHNHIKRVLALSFEILRVEQNAFKTINFDSTIIELVALFHDIDDHKYQPPANMPAPYPSPPSNMDPQIQQTPPLVDLNSSIQEQSASDSFNTDPDPQNLNENESHVETLLLQLGWPDDIASKAAAITPFVSYTAEVTNKPGFASALAQYPELAVVQDADRLDAIGAVGIGRAFTYGGAKDREGGMAGTMNHFTEKLSRLEAMMKTGEGKRMAAARAERLRIFGRWWQAEMKMVGMANDGGMEWIQGVSPWANPDPSASNSVPSQPSNQRPADQASQAALKPGLDGMDEWQRRAGQNMGGDQPMGFPPSRALDQQQNTQNMSQEQVQEQEQEQEQRPANGEGIRPEAENDDPGRQLIEAFGSTAS